MTRRSIVTLFLILIVPSTFYPQRVKKPQRNQVLKFDVPLGRTVRGFTYSREGRLSYRSESFRPSVAVNSNDVTKFSVFFFHSKNLAGVIAMDVDGQNKSFLLDLNDFSSLPMQENDSWNAAAEILLSPSQRYMLVLCGYEGNRLISVDLNTRRLLDRPVRSPRWPDKLWFIKDDPRWVGNTDVLSFRVKETCNVYDNPGCDENRKNRASVMYAVRLDVATMKFSSRRVSP
jgi:hypothetical protein